MIKASTVIERYRVRGYPLQAERRVELAALLLIVLLVACLVYNGVRLLSVSPPAPLVPSAESLIVAEIADPSIVSSSEREQIGVRPLFWRSRQPLVPPPEEVGSEDAASAVAGSLGKVKLLGVFGSAGSVGIIALVEGEKQRILAGEKILGWELKSIEGGRAQFMEGTRSEELELKLANVTPRKQERAETVQLSVAKDHSTEKAVLGEGVGIRPQQRSASGDQLTVGGAPTGAQSSDLLRAINALNETSNSRYTRQSSD